VKSIFFLTIFFIHIILCHAQARDVHVKGYYKRDGTYVRPHIRSSPDSYKWNNYGPSNSDVELMNPRLRDKDNDGVPNYNDIDDDNDGLHDDIDTRQYTPSSSTYNSSSTTPKVIAPRNAYVSGAYWFCDNGYKKVGDKCVLGSR
jgi:hypothetical protein